MDNKKTNCFNIISELESTLIKFSNDYPINVKQIIYKNDRLIGVIILVLVVINILPYIFKHYDLKTIAWVAWFIGPLVVRTVVEIHKYWSKREKSKFGLYLSQIQETRQQLVEYEQYPDIKLYLEQFDENVKKISKRKSEVNNKIKKMIIIIIVISSVIIGCNLLYFNSKYQDKVYNPVSDLQQTFNIDSSTTFITLRCLTPKTDDTTKLFGDKIDILLGEIHQQVAMFVKPTETANISNQEEYNISITDKNGNLITGCPIIYLREDSIYNASIMHHLHFEDKRCIYKDVRNTKDYYRKTYNLLTYLQTHQDNIFYKIEKIERAEPEIAPYLR